MQRFKRFLLIEGTIRYTWGTKMRLLPDGDIPLDSHVNFIANRNMHTYFGRVAETILMSS